MSDKVFLTQAEAAEFLGFTKSYLYKLVFLKAIPHYKPRAGRLLFDRTELDAWIRKGKVATVDELNAKADALLNAGASR